MPKTLHSIIAVLEDSRDLPLFRVNSKVAEEELRRVVVVARLVTHDIVPHL
jgi:hypothetical protein